MDMGAVYFESTSYYTGRP